MSVDISYPALLLRRQEKESRANGEGGRGISNPLDEEFRDLQMGFVQQERSYATECSTKPPGGLAFEFEPSFGE